MRVQQQPGWTLEAAVPLDSSLVPWAGADEKDRTAAAIVAGFVFTTMVLCLLGLLYHGYELNIQAPLFVEALALTLTQFVETLSSLTWTPMEPLCVETLADRSPSTTLPRNPTTP